MQIFVKQTVPNFNRQIAKPAAIAELKYNINFEESNLKNRNISDKSQALKNLKTWKNTLNNVSPVTLSSEQRGSMWKRAKKLKDEFTQGMLSTDELHPVRTIHGPKGVEVVVDENKMSANHSVEKQVMWSNRNNSKVLEFKNIMRQLNPENPGASDIERFRPQRSSK